MFRLAFLTLLLGVHAYLAVRLVLPLDVGTAARAGLLALIAAAALVYPVVMRVRFQRGGRGPAVEAFLGYAYLQMGVTGFLLSLLVVRDLLWLVVWLVDLGLAAAGHQPLLPVEAEARRALLVATNGGVLGLATLASVVGLLEARRPPRVRRLSVAIDALPDALEGFTLAHLTDLHVGATIKGDFVSSVVSRVNALAPDAVALTGDFVDGSVDELTAHVAPLGDLRARHGTFYVTGNHEYYSGAEAWVEHFASLGIQPLLNEHVVVEHEGGRLVVAGICDYSAASFVPHHASDPGRALASTPAGAPRVLLAHQPRSAPLVREAGGVDLMLCGHTHGGQMWPWNFFVPLQQPLVSGLHRLHDMWVYVSRGTGYWGPPFRVGAPSEIALLTLTKA